MNWFALGNAVLQGGLAIKNSIDSARKAKKAEQALKEQNAFNTSVYESQMAQNAMDRSDNQVMLNELKSQQNEVAAQQNAQNAVMGNTPNMQVAANAAAGKNYGDAIAGIARNASQLKDSYLANYQQQRNANFDATRQMHQNASAQAAQAAQNNIQAFSQSMMAQGKGTPADAGKVATSLITG